MEKVIFTLFIGKSYIKLFLHKTDNVVDFEKVWPVQVLNIFVSTSWTLIASIWLLYQCHIAVYMLWIFLFHHIIKATGAAFCALVTGIKLKISTKNIIEKIENVKKSC